MTGGAELLAVAHDYLDPLLAPASTRSILGCTHYPLLTGVISYVMGDGVTLVCSAEESAKDVYRAARRARPERDPDRRAGAPLPHHRRARASSQHRPRASSAPSSAVGVAQFAGGLVVT